jgi:hypothetical protein
MTAPKTDLAVPVPTMAALKAAVLAADPACMLDPELFTGPAGVEPEDEPEHDRAARLDAARAVCAECPVRLECLAYALRTRPTAALWAGLTAEEVAFLNAAAARPARPRKNLRPAPVAAPGRKAA